ncbi:MAG: hypothetical protein AMXMBFR12_07300 [Candidatus Babeliales bacterium]
MKLVEKEISLEELKHMSQNMFDNLVKAVVDIEKEIMVVDAPMQVDQEAFLLENDSEQENLWGINFHPHKYPNVDWIEFDSMINLRPSQGNRSRSVEDPKIREIIRKIVSQRVVS